MNPSICICENSSYLKSCADTSMTEYDEIIIVMDNVSKKTNNMPTKITKTTATQKTSVANCHSKNCHSKKVRQFHVLHIVLLVIILLLIIIIICYFYEKQKRII